CTLPACEGIDVRRNVGASMTRGVYGPGVRRSTSREERRNGGTATGAIGAVAPTHHHAVPAPAFGSSKNVAPPHGTDRGSMLGRSAASAASCTVTPDDDWVPGTRGATCNDGRDGSATDGAPPDACAACSTAPPFSDSKVARSTGLQASSASAAATASDATAPALVPRSPRFNSSSRWKRRCCSFGKKSGEGSTSGSPRSKRTP